MHASPLRSLLAAVVVLCTTQTISAFGPGSEFDAQVVAKPGNHLWFYFINNFIPGGVKTGGRCGEVDAAPYMPSSLFERRNAKELELYTQVTIKDYAGTRVGRCSDVNYTQPAGPGPNPGIWGPSSFRSICKTACGCVIGGTWGPGSKVCRETPEYCACQDVPDDPSRPSPGNFCSLCGPKYNEQRANITFYIKPVAPPPPPPPQCNPKKGCTVCAACCESFIPTGKSCDACVKDKCGSGSTIEALASATPDLSTLVAALKAGDLVPTLLSVGPFTVFAPTNEAFAALPAGTVPNLLKPQNKAQLVDILTYHVVSGDVQAKDLKDGQKLTTVEGKLLTVRVAGGSVFINSAKVTTADVEASNGVLHIIDDVLMP